MEKNKLIIGIIAVIVLVVGGVAVFHLIQPEEPVVNDVVDPTDPVVDPTDPRVEEIVAPKAILIGNKSNMFLPMKVKEGYVATFDFYREDKLVGTATWERAEEGKTKSLFTEAVDMQKPQKTTTIIKHDADLIVQRVDVEVPGFIGNELFRMVFIFDHEKYKTTVIMGELDTGGFIQDPMAFERIGLQELKPGWRREFPMTAVPPAEPVPGIQPAVRDRLLAIEVVEETTVTVPAGTFDVLRVKITLDRIGYYYITADGRLVKISNIEPDSTITFKLRSYSPIY